ncbi:hypothetical protein V7793_04820 [Streptomyces sp. KLMMK]|uniref:hypothetical protein n=1 Tax=Streptomyces sp. KLMMK TaxID=3109353 RepID=UPI002FFF1327
MSSPLWERTYAEQNEARAEWAAKACEAFGEQTGQRDYFEGPAQIAPDLLVEIGGDLLANLFHLAALNNLDPCALVRAGFLHFSEEYQEAQEEQREEEAVREFHARELPALEAFLKGDQ